jgi:hypothetical protein
VSNISDYDYVYADSSITDEPYDAYFTYVNNGGDSYDNISDLQYNLPSFFTLRA